MKRFTLLLWLCSCLVCLNAANVYVSTSGADAHDGSSWATAKLSLQAAVDVALDGDTVFVSGYTRSGALNSTSLRKA